MRLLPFVVAAVTLSLTAQDPPELVLSVGHAGAPRKAVFVGGGHLATAGDTTVHLTDVSSGLTVASLPQGALVMTLEASPVAPLLAVATCDHAVLIWDVAARRLLHRLPVASECSDMVSWSPDGTLLAVDAYGCCRGGGPSLQIWDPAAGRLREDVVRPWRARAVKFAGNGAWLAAVDDGGTAHILEWPGAREVRTFTGLESPGGSGASAIASRDGRYFGWLDGGSILVWDVTTGARVALPGERTSTILEGSPGRLESRRSVTAVPARIGTFLADGRLVYVDWDTLVTVRLSDGVVETQPLVRGPVDVTGDVGIVTPYEWLAIRPDGGLLGGHLEGRLMLWEVAAKKTRPLDPPPIAGATGVRWSASGLIAWAGLSDPLRGWDTRRGRLVRLHPRIDSSEHLAFSPDGRTMALSGFAGTHLLDVGRRRSIASIDTPIGAASAIAFSPDGTRVALDNGEGLGVFDTRLGLERRLAVTSQVTQLTWSGDGRWIAAAVSGAESMLQVWPANAAGAAVTLDRRRVHANNPLGFSAGADHLAAVLRGHDVMVWTAPDWSLARTWTLPRRAEALAFSPAGDRLAITGNGDTGVWRADTATRLLTLTSPGSSSIDSVAWSPDGQRLVTTSDEGVLAFWDAADGRLLASIYVWAESDDWLLVTPDGRLDGTAVALRTAVAWRTGGQVTASGALTRRARVDGLWRLLGVAP